MLSSRRETLFGLPRRRAKFSSGRKRRQSPSCVQSIGFEWRPRSSSIKFRPSKLSADCCESLAFIVNDDRTPLVLVSGRLSASASVFVCHIDDDCFACSGTSRLWLPADDSVSSRRLPTKYCLAIAFGPHAVTVPLKCYG